MKYLYFFILSTFLLLSACGQSTDNSLSTAQISIKEKELQEWEETLKLKEQELVKYEKMLDSVRNEADTTMKFNPALAGSWKVTMDCIETNCPGSAIGDTKTEQWDISFEDNRLVANAIVQKKLIRTYEGVFNDNNLDLTAIATPGANTTITATLAPHATLKDLLEGQRIVNQIGKCRTVYNLKAEKLN